MPRASAATFNMPTSTSTITADFRSTTIGEIKLRQSRQRGEDAPLAERKWIPTSETDAGASYVAINPPKCAFISLVMGDYPTAVILESHAIALAQQVSFDTLWQRLQAGHFSWPEINLKMQINDPVGGRAGDG